MAKNIKAIKCPNCGSVLKTEIKPEMYVCNNCSTEYFLDDDDVNINHNYQRRNLDAKTLKIIGIAVASILLLFIISTLFERNPAPAQEFSKPEPKIIVEEEESFSINRNEVIPYMQESSQKPLVVILESRSYSPEKFIGKNGFYLAFYDPITKKLIHEELLKIDEKSSRDLSFRTFSDGNIYMILNKNSFYKINKETFELQDIGATFFKAQDKLQIGIASLEFDSPKRGDILLVHTNDDQEFYYYPLAQELYTKKQYYTIYKGFNTLNRDAKVKTLYKFTDKSYDYPEEKIQLIKLLYKDNGYGPKELATSLEWSKDYGRAGIFTGNEPHKKKLLNDYQMLVHRVLSLKDITPERLYFYPKVKLDDGIHLIIQFKADISEKSDFILQELNRETGEVIWTTVLPHGTTIESMISFDKGFIGISSNENISIFDTKGKLVEVFNQ